MKQSKMLDLILKRLYNYKHDGTYYSITEILQNYGLNPTFQEVFTIGKRLEADGLIDFLGHPDDVLGQLTSTGIDYVEEDSYTSRGKAIINNNYNISIANSPHSTVINQSSNVNINNIHEQINKNLDHIIGIIQ
jgi:hypothetical protein